MDNHAHLLLRAERADLSKLMQRTEISYAQYFNGRHGHVGKVFQNRFNAQPITSESHLLAAIRYIHRNPLDIEEDVDQYAWSSYQEIVEGKGGITDSAAVLELFAGIDGFLSFHNNANEEDGFERIDGYRRRLDDAEAIDIALKAFGQSFADRITSMPKAERDKALAQYMSLASCPHRGGPPNGLKGTRSQPSRVPGMLTERGRQAPPFVPNKHWRRTTAAGYSAASFENCLLIITEGLRACLAPDPCDWRTK